MSASRVVISLGSNIAHPTDLARDLTVSISANNPADIVKCAIHELQKLSESSLTMSSLYQTAAIDCPPNTPDFVNAVALLDVAEGLGARELLRRMQDIETQFGRRRTGVLNEPRTLDLDLISFGDLQCSEPDLMLPHPRAHLRGFVMVPLAEVAPDYVLPGQSLTARQLATALAVGPQRVIPVN